MKEMSLLSVMCIIMVGCLSNYPAMQHSERLSYVPLEPINEAIELIFPEDSLPEEKFFYIQEFKVFGDPTQHRDSVITKMKLKGMSEGVDAVIISDQSFKPWLDTNLKANSKNSYKVTLDANGNLESEPIYVEKWAVPLIGTGIKYLKNMGYIVYYNKSEIIEARSIFTGNFWEAAKIKYNIEGLITDLKDTMGYLYYFDRYSMSHLIHEESDQWAMKITDDNLLIRKYYTPERFFIKRCIVEFDEMNRPVKINISYRGRKPNETIYCFYDAQSRLVQRELHLNKYGVLTEKRKYDELGRLNSSVYINEKGEYKFRRSWAYFNTQDLYDYKKENLSLSNRKLD